MYKKHSDLYTKKEHNLGLKAQASSTQTKVLCITVKVKCNDLYVCPARSLAHGRYLRNPGPDAELSPGVELKKTPPLPWGTVPQRRQTISCKEMVHHVIGAPIEIRSGCQRSRKEERKHLMAQRTEHLLD